MIAPKFEVCPIALVEDARSAAVHRMYQDAFAEEYGGMSLESFVNDFHEVPVYGAFYRNRIIGLAIFDTMVSEPEEMNDTTLDWFAVDEPSRKLGYGSLFLGELEAVQVKRQKSRINLTTYSSDALKFYVDHDYTLESINPIGGYELFKNLSPVGLKS